MYGSWNAFDLKVVYSDPLQIGIREHISVVLRRMGIYNGIGVEIGVLNGDFSEILLNTTDLSKLYLIDAWKNFKTDYNDANNVSDEEHEQRYQAVVERMKHYGDRVEITRGDCDDAVKECYDESLDFIYLDANHEYYAIKRNLHDWYPKLKVGGLFSGHDYLDGVMGDGTVIGVKRAVNEFVAELGNIKLYSTKDDTPFKGNTNIRMPYNKRYFSWYFQKV